jgi:hypothetical protein
MHLLELILLDGLVNNCSSRARHALARRVFASVLSIAALGACSNDSTSPTGAITSASVIVVTGGLAQTAPAGTTLATPIMIQVRDASGIPVPGVTVTFAPTTGSGSVTIATAVSDSTGSAKVTWTLGTATGHDSLTVASGVLTPVSVVATVTAGPAATVTVVAGNNQTAVSGSTLPIPLAVRVIDQFGNLAANATVAWTAGGGTVSSATSISDSNGIAQVAYTLAGRAGAQNVTATATTGTHAIATFVETGS